MIFGGQGVGAEEGRLDADPPLARKRARRAQHLQFVVGRQPITRFDLDRRDALGDQRVEAGQRACDQFGLARAARRAHRRDNAATRAGDLFIASARKPHRPLVRAVAAMNQMRVAVDQARGDEAAAAIMDGSRRRRGAAGGSGIDDPAVLRGHHAIVDQAETIVGHRRDSGVRPELLHLDSLAPIRHYV